MAAITSFHAEKCCHLVSKHKASACSSSRQFLICIRINLFGLMNKQLRLVTAFVSDADTALPRLERIYRRIVDEQLDVEVDVIRVNNVNMSYPVLRQIDWNNKISDKHVIIDFSSNRAVQKVLRQVSGFVVSLSLPSLSLSLSVHEWPVICHTRNRNRNKFRYRHVN